MQTPATVEGIERALSLDILRGRYAAGSRLPTVRELAATHEVNPATIQRVVARLETRGLIVARQGSGLCVQDPLVAGDVGLLPLWLVALEERPAEARRLLEGVLELRRLIAVRLIVRHRRALSARQDELSAAALGLLDAAALDVAARAAADIAFARKLVEICGEPVALAVFNTLARAVEESPALASAMFASPAENVRAMRAVLSALAQRREGLARVVDTELAAQDARTVTRFARALARRRP
ncbi:MAG: GntR family transcriptional regulator [Polyangiaceae bacterium]|nr:GntR family transcriptional regulator [Polyangiaceae bacterium]